MWTNLTNMLRPSLHFYWLWLLSLALLLLWLSGCATRLDLGLTTSPTGLKLHLQGSLIDLRPTTTPAEPQAQ